jgi:hypothetical protein
VRDITWAIENNRRHVDRRAAGFRVTFTTTFDLQEMVLLWSVVQRLANDC